MDSPSNHEKQTIELDAQVEQLRKVLEDPLRISQVSGNTFPLRVWERMFALDRERGSNKKRTPTKKDDENDDDRNDDDHEEGGASSSARNKSPNRDGAESEYSASRRSNSPSTTNKSSYGSSSSSVLFGNRRKPPQLRNCRDNSSNPLNARAMRSLVRETMFPSSSQHHRAAEVDGEDNAADSSSSRLADGGRNLFKLINDREERRQPTAVISCVTVPDRISSSSAAADAASTATKIAVNINTNTTNNSSTNQQHQQQQLQLLKSANRSNDNGLSEGFRADPIRAFSPIASFWGPVGGSTLVAIEQQKQQNRLQAMARPAVERHDLPFEVTPSNDFRNLAFPLTGLGHEVPYDELQREQVTLMERCTKENEKKEES